MGLGFAYSLLLGRALGVKEFGLMALGISFSSTIFNLIEVRLQEAVIRFVAKFDEHNEVREAMGIIKLSLIVDVSTGLIALFLIVALSPLAQTYLSLDARGREIIFLSGLSLFFSNVATATATGVVRLYGQFKYHSIISMAGVSCKLLLSLVAVIHLGYGVIGVLWVSVITSFVINLALVTLAYKVLKRQVGGRLSWPSINILQPHFPEIKAFTTSTYLVSITGIPTKELDSILLGWFTTPDAVGIYRIAKNFMLALWMFADPAFIVIYPELAKLWIKTDWEQLRRFVIKISLTLGCLGGVLFILSYAFVPLAITRMMGGEYASSGNIFLWMLWSILFWFPFLWVNPLLMASGRPDLTLRAALIESGIILIIYLVLIPKFGAMGAALTYGLATPLVVGLALFLGYRNKIIFPGTNCSQGNSHDITNTRVVSS